MPAALMTVSYTHLDVYKRQDACLVLLSGRFGCSTIPDAAGEGPMQATKFSTDKDGLHVVILSLIHI